MANPVANRGRLINFINGITGIAAGGQAVVNMPVNQRNHRLIFQCAAINYTGGTAQATTKITGAGANNLTVTPTIVNGVITSVAVVAGGTGYVTGDTITITDATGAGFVGTVTAAAGVVTAVAVTVTGTATAVDPATFFTGVKLLVNGVNMRDIDPVDVLKIAMANGLQPQLGEFPLYFTAPWRNILQQNETNSWDLFGQSTFQIQFAISSTVSLPALSGVQEFDYMRNVMPGPKGEPVPFLQPVAQHSFTWPIVAGRNDINTIPFSFPITRMWFQGSTADQITQVEIYQDNNKILEATLAQVKQAYTEYGFYFGGANYLNQSRAASSTLQAQFALLRDYDAAFIADPDQRSWKALSCANSLIVRIYSAVAQNLTIVQETLPGSFQS